MTTIEFCPYCEEEVTIDADQPSICPACQKPIIPCSTCPHLEPGNCKEVNNGCTRYPER